LFGHSCKTSEYESVAPVHNDFIEMEEQAKHTIPCVEHKVFKGDVECENDNTMMTVQLKP